MPEKTTRTRTRSRRKSVDQRGSVDHVDAAKGVAQLSLPIAEILAGVGDAAERVAGEAGLLIIEALIDEEVESLAGTRSAHDERRQAHRWGHEASHVVSGGKEISLERLELFQTGGRMQVPKRCHSTYTNRLRLAWDMLRYEDAKKELETMVDELETIKEHHRELFPGDAGARAQREEPEEREHGPPPGRDDAPGR